MESVEELCDHITLIDDGVRLVEGDISDIRKEYKSNTYQIGFQGDANKIKTLLNGHFEILSITKRDDHEIARIRIVDNSPANELLAALIPMVTILSFNEELPGMRDIFISIVKEGKKNKS
jgi:ABC-2 type transport system ATP-binding protein